MHCYYQEERTGFTLIEILVVLAIIALLSAILFPVFGRVRENARASACQSNLHQISMGLLQYTQDWDEYTVPVQNYEVINSTLQEVPWQFRIQPYVQSAQVFKCPSFPRRGVFNVYATGGGNQPAAIPRSYYLNGGNEGAAGTSDFGGKRPFRKHDKGVVPFAQVLYPATTIAMTELQGGQSDPKISDLTYVTDGTTFNAFLNHSGLTNFAFMDGHVKTMKPSQTATTEINMWTNSNATDTTPTATKGATANLQSKLATAESLLQ